MIRPFRTMVLILCGILAFALLPFASIFAASGVATALGCRLDEGSSHPCVIAGLDLADLLYGMFVLGWLALATMPLGGLALLVWMVAAVIIYFRTKPTSP